MENVLSLFDGMSCLQIALQRMDIKYKKYFASEVDKHAIKATQHNFPKTIQIGDVTKVSGYDLPIMDFIGGGSPCQGFSFAGKGLNFDDSRSKLFFEYVRILKECREKNPSLLFLLENVKMKEEHEKVISKLLGVNPILINSTLVSAQNRERLYWTNIGLEPRGLFGDLHSTIQQPKDKGIILSDVLEDEVADKYFINESTTNRLLHSDDIDKKRSSINADKTLPLLSRQYSNCRGNFIAVVNDIGGLRKIGDKSLNIDANYFKGYDNHGARTMIVCHNVMPRNGDPKKGGTGHLSRKDGKSYALDTQQSNRIQRLFDFNNGGQGSRVYDCNAKVIALNAMGGGQGAKTGLYQIDSRIRRLTPKECCRLQTVDDDYFEGTNISDTQQYKMLGNGWTIDVIVHILSYIK